MSGGVSGLQNLKMIASVVLGKVETQQTNTNQASNEPLFDYSNLKLGQGENNDVVTENYAILAMNGFARGNEYQVEGYDQTNFGIQIKENDEGGVDFYVTPNEWNNSSDTNRCLHDIVKNTYNVTELARASGVSPQYMVGFLKNAVVSANGMSSTSSAFPKGENGDYLPLKLPSIDEMVEMVRKGNISNSKSIKEINVDTYYVNVVGMTPTELEEEAKKVSTEISTEDNPIVSETPVEESEQVQEQSGESEVEESESIEGETSEDTQVSIEEMETALSQLANIEDKNQCLDEIYEDYNNFCENLDAATSHNHTYNEEQSEYIQNLYNKLEGYNQIFAEMDNLNLSDDIKDKYKNNPDIMQDLYDLKSKNNDGQELSYSDLAQVIYENSSPFTQYENLYPIFNAMLEDSPYAEGLASENPQEYFKDFTNFGIESDRFTQLKEAYGYTYYEPANPAKAKEFIKDIAQNNDLSENEKAFFMMYVSNGDPQSLIHNFVNINGLLYTENFEKDNIGALFDLYSGNIQNASNTVSSTETTAETETTEADSAEASVEENESTEEQLVQNEVAQDELIKSEVAEDTQVSIEEMETALSQLANIEDKNQCIDEIYEEYNEFCESLDAAALHNHTYNEAQSEYIQNLYNKLEGYNQIFAEMDNLNLSDDIKENYKNNPDIMQGLYDLKSKNNDGQELSYSDLAQVIYENSSPFTQYENLYPIFNAMLEDSPYAEGLASENPQEYFKDFTNFGIESDRFNRCKEEYGYACYEPANPEKAKEFIKDITQNNDLSENEKAFFMMYVSNGNPQSLIHNFVNINGLLYTENFEKDNIGALFDLYSGNIQNASNTVSSTETTAETETTESNSNEVSSELTASDGSLVSDKSTEYIDKITSNDMTWDDFITELETNESEEVQGAIVEQIWRQIQNIDDSMLTNELRALKYNVDLDG